MMDLNRPLLQSWRTRTGKEEVMDEEKGGHRGGEPAPKLQRSYFDVLGICCSSEIPLVETILKPIDGVKDVSVIVVSRTVIVVHDGLLVSQTQIVNALNKARLEASLKGSGDDLQNKMKWPSPYAIASGVLLLLSLFKYIYDPLKWIALGAVASGILPIFSKSIAALRGLRIDINILALCAVIGTIVLNEYIEAGTIVFLFTIAQWLESRAGHKASSAMSSLMTMAPQKATIAQTGEVVDVNEVELNTVVAVKPGEVIPIDGLVVDGISEVDEKTLTGESFPVSKQIESLVWAGTINLNGYISVRTTALAKDCVVARMVKLVEEAQKKKSRIQKFIDEFAKYYTPAVLVISIAFAVVPLALRVPDQDQWLCLALVVLVSACPCALILSTPVATFCALTKAAEHGLLFKGGDYLETLGKVKTVAFDKTGTITRGEFSISEFQSIHAEVTLNTLLYWVSSIESKSSHPMAAPLVQYARSFRVDPRPEDVEDFQNFPGQGIYGKVDGRDVYIGSKRIAVKAGSEIDPSLHINAMGGKTVGYVYVGATLAGIFSLSDECRTGVAEAIEQLKSLNIKTAILTGDSQEAATYALNQLRNAPDLVYAELLPEEKLKIIEELKKDGLTAMVGDGINDAPSLAASNIGISMGISGSALAVETGHLIMMSNDIGNIPRAVILGRKAQRKVIENVIVSVLTKVAVLALAFAGHPLVWVAVLADTGTCLMVILNSMLLLRENRGDGLGQERCRRLPVSTEGKATVDEISLGQNSCQCCAVKNCGSSVHVDNSSVKAQVPNSEGQRDCCKSGRCPEQKDTQEKVTRESRCCPSEKYETKSNPCKSRSCCSGKRGDEKPTADEFLLDQNCRDCCGPTAVETKSVTTCKSRRCCSEKRGNEKPTADEILSDQNRRNCCGPNNSSSSVLVGDSLVPQAQVQPDSEGQSVCCKSGKCLSEEKGLREKVACESGCCSSKQYETKPVSCQSKSCCSGKRVDEKENSTGYAVSLSKAMDISGSSSPCSGRKMVKSVDTSYCSQGKCSTTKNNDPKLVLGHSEPIQRGKDIESVQVQEEITQLVKIDQASRCCKNRYRKECSRSCCLTEIVTA